jgi:uncharacterized protein YndB with AHSA1/START domain
VRTIAATASVQVGAAPEAVYDLVSDVRNIPSWSPECRRCTWVDGATGPAVGARFKGWNRRGPLRWATVCEVTEAEPGRTFAWEVQYPVGGPHTRWRYEFSPVADGTEVTESFELLREPPELRLYRLLAFRGTPARVEELTEGMRQTLARLKVTAEA